MSNIVPSIVKSYKGKSIRIREDNYVCLTDMATASGRLLGGWTRLKGTKEYLLALSSVMQIGISDNHAGSGGLIEIVQGVGVEQCTWAHPEVAVEFAAWCSIDFKIQVNRWVLELMTKGIVSIATIKPDTDREVIRQQGKIDRSSITVIIKDAGGQSYDFARFTDDVYIQITGMTAKELRIDRNVPKNKSAREGLTTTELYAVSLVERATAANIAPGSNISQIRRDAIIRAEKIAAAIA